MPRSKLHSQVDLDYVRAIPLCIVGVTCTGTRSETRDLPAAIQSALKTWRVNIGLGDGFATRH